MILSLHRKIEFIDILVKFHFSDYAVTVGEPKLSLSSFQSLPCFFVGLYSVYYIEAEEQR